MVRPTDEDQDGAVAALRIANLTVAFLLEVAMLVAFAVWGFSLDVPVAVRVLVGVGLPVLAAALWGAVLAPRSSRRLRMPWIALVKLALFFAAALALAASAHPALGLLLASTAAVSVGLAVLLRQDEVVSPVPGQG
jgi:hypothetical protein